MVRRLAPRGPIRLATGIEGVPPWRDQEGKTRPTRQRGSRGGWRKVVGLVGLSPGGAMSRRDRDGSLAPGLSLRTRSDRCGRLAPPRHELVGPRVWGSLGASRTVPMWPGRMPACGRQMGAAVSPRRPIVVRAGTLGELDAGRYRGPLPARRRAWPFFEMSRLPSAAGRSATMGCRAPSVAPDSRGFPAVGARFGARRGQRRSPAVPSSPVAATAFGVAAGPG